MFVSKIHCLIIFLAIYCPKLTAQGFCSFSYDCNCEQNPDGSYSVICAYFGIFPTFSPFNGTIESVEITGTFTSIPANAFAGLQNFPRPTVTFWRNGDQLAPLTIDDDAFILPTSQNNYESITFKDYKNMSIPTTALSKISVNVLEFLQGSFNTIPDNSFQGVQVTALHFLMCGIQAIEPSAFVGFNPQGGTKVVLDFAANRLTEVPAAIANVSGLSILFIGTNQITKVGDNAFCSSNNCPDLDTISLEGNQISSISSSAFFSLPSLTRLRLSNNQITSLSAQVFQSNKQLFSLSLDHNLLTTIPTLSLPVEVAKNIYDLKLDNNQITSINANSFYGFARLSTLTLDNNPVISVDNGAFNGLAWSVLNITNLPSLQTVDVLATFGMLNVQTFHVDNCDTLQNITMIDFDKVSSTLKKIMVSNSGLRSIDPNFDAWLKAAPDNYLDISYNKNFFCNTTDVAWMAPYIVCPESQILVQETYCGDTQVPLFAYMDVEYKPTCP